MADKHSILIADDEQAVVHELQRHLEAAGYDIHVASDGYSALTKARVVGPDLILLDLGIGGLRGMEVKNRLNLESSTVHIPVIFMADEASTEDKITGFNLKAEDVVVKPLNLPELTARIGALSRRYRERHQLLATDALTGLNNLHVFKRSLMQLFNVAQRYRRPFSLAVADLDHFKKINDTYGHSTGDRAIQCVAQYLKRCLRETDILIRYGGDEFVVLLPETGGQEAAEAMQRFKAAVESTEFSVAAKTKLALSVSVGLASFEESMRRPSDLFELADKRMYEAKHAKKPNAGKTLRSVRRGSKNKTSA